MDLNTLQEKLKIYRLPAIVKVGKITGFISAEDKYLLYLGDVDYIVSVTESWMNRHNPVKGGYLVFIYGSISYLPEASFEDLVMYELVLQVPDILNNINQSIASIQSSIPGITFTISESENVNLIKDLFNFWNKQVHDSKSFNVPVTIDEPSESVKNYLSSWVSLVCENNLGDSNEPRVKDTSDLGRTHI